MANPDPDVKQLLADLRDFNKERRRKAVYKLGMAGGEEALRALMVAVEDANEDLIVRGRAAQMLGMMRDPRAVDSLINALSASGYQTPIHAAQALGIIGDKRAIGPLRVVADEHGNDRTRKAAGDALTALGYDPTVESKPLKPEPEM
jgi:HEAT repeat protein